MDKEENLFLDKPFWIEPIEDCSLKNNILIVKLTLNLKLSTCNLYDFHTVVQFLLLDHNIRSHVKGKTKYHIAGYPHISVPLMWSSLQASLWGLHKMTTCYRTWKRVLQKSQTLLARPPPGCMSGTQTDERKKSDTHISITNLAKQMLYTWHFKSSIQLHPT